MRPVKTIDSVSLSLNTPCVFMTKFILRGDERRLSFTFSGYYTNTKSITQIMNAPSARSLFVSLTGLVFYGPQFTIPIIPGQQHYP